MAEHHPARSESLQPHTEQKQSTRSRTVLCRLEADLYVWRYALLVVHARKEEEEEDQSVNNGMHCHAVCFLLYD